MAPSSAGPTALPVSLAARCCGVYGCWWRRLAALARGHAHACGVVGRLAAAADFRRASPPPPSPPPPPPPTHPPGTSNRYVSVSVAPIHTAPVHRGAPYSPHSSASPEPLSLLRVLLPLTCAGTHTARAVVTVGNQQAVRRSMAYSGVLPRKTSVDRKNAGT